MATPDSVAVPPTSDRCLAIIGGNFMVPRCGLKLGHDGPHESIKVGSEPPDFPVPGDDLGY